MNNIGFFKMSQYMDKLYENINVDKIEDKDGIVIPEENKKAYDWLKKEYTSAKQEVKVEMKVGGAKFNPGYEMQADVESADKEFKPGMFGNSVPKTPKSGKESDFKPNNFSSKSTSTKSEESKDTEPKESEETKKDETKKSESKSEDTLEKQDYKKSEAKVGN